MGKFEIKSSASDKCMFNLKADNGQVILTSQSYTSKDGCKNGIESVRKNSQSDAQFERKTAKDGSPFFTLNATNGQVIGKSEMYSSKEAMEKGIASVKKNALGAEITDNT
ncbi:MAG: YegP family protein [Bacteroidota bacterium]